MEQLDAALVSRVWPAERVVAGTRMCKYLREALCLHCARITLQSNGRTADIASIVEGISRFQCHVAGFELIFGSHDENAQSVLSAFQLAIHRNWHGRLILLRLTSSKCQRVSPELRGFASNRAVAPLLLWYERVLTSVVNCGLVGHLASLDLHNNKTTCKQDLAKMLPVLQQCSRLVSLHLGSTNLTCAMVNTVGAENTIEVLLHRMSVLQHLDLGDNPTLLSQPVPFRSALSKSFAIRHLELQNTGLSTPNIQALADGVASLTALTYLGLGENGIDDAGARILWMGLKDNQRLWSLDLCMNRIVSANHLESCSFDKEYGPPSGLRIKKLNLEQNQLGMWTRLASGRQGQVAVFELLTDLDVSCNAICNDTIAELSSLLDGSVSLRKLRMYHDSLGVDGIQILDTFMRYNTVLSHLDLTRNLLMGDGGKFVSNIIARSTDITTLALGENVLGAWGLTHLVGGLRQCSALCVLDLSCNDLGPCGAKSLAETLGELASLETLQLQCNHIGDEGLKFVAAVLGDCRSLMHLDLGWNDLAACSGFHLACVLGQCSRLETLKLGSNSLGREGGWYILGALPDARRLRDVDLAGCNIGLAADRLADELPLCQSLSHLNLSFNGIGCEGALSIAKGIPLCTQLAVLDLSYNNSGYDAAQQLLSAPNKCGPRLTIKMAGARYN